MADDVKKVEVAITSTYDGKAAAQAAADMEGLQGKAKFDPSLPFWTKQAAAAQDELTNSGKGLASTLPDLNAKTQAYVVTTEAEYLAIQKAHDALVKRIPVLQAAGKETAEYEQTLAKLSEALSTNEALTIAETIEAKAMAKAQLEQAAATDTATAAAEGQILTGRKMVSLFDEISRGQRGAMISTLGSLLKSGGAEGVLPILGSLAAVAAGFEIWNHVVNETAESLGELKLPDLSDGIRKAEDLGTAWNGVSEAVSEADLAFNSVEEASRRATAALEAQADAANKALDAETKLLLAQLDLNRATGKVPEGQYEAKREEIEREAADKKTQAAIDARNRKLGEEINSVTNFDLEKKRDEAAVQAITKNAGLGATPDIEKAHQAALQDIVKAQQAEIDDARKQMATLNQADEPGTNPATAAKDWTSLIAHYGLRVTTPSGYQAAMQMEQARITAAEGGQKQILQQIAQLQAAEAQREALQKAAAGAAGKEETAKQQTKDQENPNVTGSVAWQNAQDRANQKQTDIASLNTEAADEIAGLKEHGANLAETIKDLVAIMKQIASLGGNIGDLRAAIDNLQAQLDRTKNYSTSIP